MPITWIASRTTGGPDFNKDLRKSFTIQPKSVIKESIQNSQDACKIISPENLKSKTLLEYDDSETVEVVYQIIELTGQAKVNWLSTFDFESFEVYLNYLLAALKAKNTDNKNKNEIQRIESAIKRAKNPNDSIFLLNVIDRNTTGLVGPTKPGNNDKTNWSGFFYILNNSEKQAGGGSWAVGKTAFATCSEIYSLIATTNTNPENSTYDSTRTYGLSLQKPSSLDKFVVDGEFTHQDGLSFLDANWYFGVSTEKINETEVPPVLLPKPIVGEESKQINKELYLNVLDSNSTGTAIQVPFFDMKYYVGNSIDEEGKKEAENLDEMVAAFENEILSVSWESILSKKINIKIEYGTVESSNQNQPELKQVDLKHKIAEFRSIKYFKELSDGIRQTLEDNSFDYNVESIEKKNYFFNDIDLQIPKKTGGITSKFSHRAHLAVKILNDEELAEIDPFYQNKIAFIRGAGLVIEYRDIMNPDEELPLIGVYYLGSSLSNDSESIMAEEFTRLCEDRAHNTVITDNKINLLIEEYFKYERRAVTENYLKGVFIEPLQTKISELLEKESSEETTKNYDLEALLNWGKVDPSEGFIKSVTKYRTSRNKVRVTCKIPPGKTIEFKNYSANTEDGLGNRIYGLVNVEKVEADNTNNCYVEIDSNIIKFTNKIETESNPTFIVTYEKLTELGQHYLSISPKIDVKS